MDMPNGKLQKTATTVLGNEELILVSRIRRRPDQPRQFFDPDKLKSLALSIAAVGQKIAILVRPIDAPDHDYELIEGERRWRVHIDNDWPEIKAIVKHPESDDEAWIDSLVANACREGYTPREIVYAAERLQGKGWTNSQIAAAFGRSETWLYQYLNLANLPDQILDLMEPNRPSAQRLKVQVAGQIAQIEGNRDLQLELATEVCKKKMSAVQAIDHVKRKAFESGQAIGTLAGSPNKDYRKLDGLAGRLPSQINPYMDMPGDRFESMFAERDADEVFTVVEHLRTSIESLQAIHDAVQRIAKQKMEDALDE